MSFLLDTDVLIEIENNNKDLILKVNRLRSAPQEELYISIFTYVEYYFGAREKSERNKEKARQRLEMYNLLNTSSRTAEIFCDLFHTLLEKGKPIPQFDVFIAACAIEHNLTLITKDHHFKEIERLKSIILA